MGNFNPINLDLHLLRRRQNDNPFVRILGVAEYALILFEPCIYFVRFDFDVILQIALFDNFYGGRWGLPVDCQIIDIGIIPGLLVGEIFRFDGRELEVVDREIWMLPSDIQQ